jgi:RNA recognition motif-containing protein
MSRLWISNLPPDANAEEMLALLTKYGFPPFVDMTVMPGSRPAAVFTFDGVDEETLRQLQPRVHGLYVRERTLHVQVAPPARLDPR